ncbi:MAG: hypothetical protein ABI542_05575 [Gemmatimonadota bacterium]
MRRRATATPAATTATAPTAAAATVFLSAWATFDFTDLAAFVTRFPAVDAAADADFFADFTAFFVRFTKEVADFSALLRVDSAALFAAFFTRRVAFFAALVTRVLVFFAAFLTAFFTILLDVAIGLLRCELET